MSIMTQLEFELNFSNSEKNIAKYILDNGENVLNLSIKELAKETYTSPATIVRLCQKLGLDGSRILKSNIQLSCNMIIKVVSMSIFHLQKMITVA
ncbi:hypothetical protein SD457_07710 [Coprobacillaceae bacterium CR2/5/TPMF4]|nr:hypothetical protein SD457_07710 [Coprobacillaceae bacterium CR2/5/TPMF4]